MSAHHSDKPVSVAKPSAHGVKLSESSSFKLPKPAAESSAALVTTSDKTPTPSPPSDVQKPKPLFAVAIVVIATLPIGLGLGTALRPKPVAPVESVACDAHETEPSQASADLVKTVLANRKRADELFRTGEFELALQLYQSKEQVESLRPSDKLALQIATCHQALGHWEEALDTFRTFASREDSPFRAPALLSQGRVWISLHDYAQAKSVLDGLARLSEVDHSISAEIQQEARFLAEIAALLEGTTFGDRLSGSHPIPPLHGIVWPVLQAFEEADAHHSKSPSGPEPVEGHSLDGPADTAEATAETRSAIAEQRLRALIEQYPRHWLSGQARLALAHSAVLRGDLTEAIARYNELIKPTATDLSVTAAFNRGLVQFRQREFGPASIALGRMVDGAPGHELIVPALILRGRALLEVGDFETAAFDFKRAATLRGKEDEQSWATAYMGMAFLQMNKHHQAAQTMLVLKDRFDSGPSRSAAALVNSLARFETLSDPASRDRESVFLYRALSGIDENADWLGSTGVVLIGRAYRNLSLPEKMVELYSKALANEIREPVASEMRFALAEHSLATGNVDDGRKQLVALSHAKRSSWSQPAAMRLAKLELDDGRYSECVSLCQEIAKEESLRDTALHMMGQAFERSGDFGKAAACYAGNLP